MARADDLSRSRVPLDQDPTLQIVLPLTTVLKSRQNPQRPSQLLQTL